MRWLYHLTLEAPAGHEPFAPPSLTTEGFVHCSYRDAVLESARLYFAGREPLLLRIDPRRLDVPVVDEPTPRGPMPHVFGSIPARAIVETSTLSAIATAPDLIDEG